VQKFSCDCCQHNAHYAVCVPCCTLPACQSCGRRLHYTTLLATNHNQIQPNTRRTQAVVGGWWWDMREKSVPAALIMMTMTRECCGEGANDHSQLGFCRTKPCNVCRFENSHRWQPCFTQSMIPRRASLSYSNAAHNHRCCGNTA